MDSCPKISDSPDYLNSRRRFLKWVIGTLTLLVSMVLGLPFLRTVIRSAPPKKMEWSEVGDVTAISLNAPQKMNFPIQSEDAYLRGVTVRSVWVIKNDNGDLTVFSPVCTHLGCYYTWNNKTAQFECPCHASVFSLSGKVLGGPAPRQLDRLQYRVENGRLSIRWEEFKSGTTEKIEV